jgi:hypothetical protein
MNFLKEILWLIIAFLIALLVQYKITSVIDYNYFIANTLVIVVSIYYLKMAASFKDVFFVKLKWVKYFVFAANLFLFVFIVTRIQKVIALYDVFSVTAYSNKFVLLDPTRESNLLHYIQKEYLFFSIFALVSIVVLNIKIITSFWKKY